MILPGSLITHAEETMNSLMTILCCLLSCTAWATDYFISTSGHDSRAGTSPTEAWATLDKVEAEAAHFLPGDRILFKRGDVFYGRLILHGLKGSIDRYITFGAYGSGPNPVIDGSVAVSGWRRDKANIWVATADQYLTAFPLKGVYLDDRLLPKARYPNADAPNGGYLTIDQNQDFNEKNIIMDKALPGLFPDNFWQGAEVVVRTRNYLLDVATVRNHRGNTLHTTPLTYGTLKDFGYFFQNAYAALDQDREWYYNSAKKELYIYFRDLNPNDHAIRVAYHPIVFGLSQASYVIIENVTFQRGSTGTVHLKHINHCYFRQNQVLNSAENGLEIVQAAFLTITDNVINQTQNNAFELTHVNNSIIRDNQIHNTGLVAGMGTSGNGQYISCFMRGKHNLFAYNTVVNSGYNAIHFNDGPWTITRNFVDSFNITKSDGGGIYCFRNTAGGNRVYQNIILHGIGALEGAALTHTTNDRGLYADGGSCHIIYEDNTIAYCGEGMLIHESNHITATGNTMVGSRGTTIHSSCHGHKNPDIRNLLIKNNILVAANDHMPVYAVQTEKNDSKLFGTFDENILSQPLSSVTPPTAYIFSTRKDKAYPEKRKMKDQYFTFEDLAGGTYGSHDKLSPIFYTRFKPQSMGANLINNATMDKTLSDNSSWLRQNTSDSSFSISRTTENMEGNLLVAQFTDLSQEAFGAVVQKNIAVTKDAYYQLTFDVRGTTASSFAFVFRTGSSGTIHTARPFHINTETTTYVYVFKAAETTPNGRIFLEMNTENQQVFFDNITLEPVNVAETDFNAIVRLEYNNSRQDKVVRITEGYVYLDGTTVPTTIHLKPFESRVLLKKLPQQASAR